MRKLVILLLFVVTVCACGSGAVATPTPSPFSATRTLFTGKGAALPTPKTLQAQFENDLPEGHLFLTGYLGSTYSLFGHTLVKLSDRDIDKLSPSGKYAATYDLEPSLGGANAGPVTIRDVTGATVAKISGNVYVENWSPDDSMLAFAAIGQPGIRILNVRSGETLDIDVPSDLIFWSPDSSALIAEQEANQSGHMLVIHHVDIKTGEVRDITDLVPGHPVSFSPGGRYLASLTGGNAPGIGPWRPAVLDLQTGTSCTVVPAKDYETKMGGGRPSFDWSPDGRYLVVTDASGPVLGAGYTRVDVARPDTCAVQTISEGVVGYAWAPDGQTIALGVLKSIKDWYPDPGKADIFLWSPNSGLRDLNIAASYPKWSPDGTEILAPDGINGGTLRILQMPELRETDVTVPIAIVNMEWSPSGRFFAVVQSGPTSAVVYLFVLQTGQLGRVAEIDYGTSFNEVFLRSWGP